MSSPAAVRAYALGQGSAVVNPWDYFQQSDLTAIEGTTWDPALMMSRALSDGASTYPNGFTLHIPPGAYPLQSALTVSSDGVTIEGSGRGTVLSVGSYFPANTPMIWDQAPATGFRQGARVRDLLLQSTAGISGVIGLQLDSTYYAVVERVDIEGVLATSIYLNGSSSYFGAYTAIRDCHLGAIPGGGGSAGTGIASNNHEHWTVEHCTINWFNNAGGVGIKVTSSACAVTDCHFDECDTALWLYFNQLARVIGNNFDRGVTRFLYLNGCNMCRVIGNDFDTRAGTGADAVYLDNNAADNLIQGNSWQTGTSWTNAIHDNANTGKVNYYSANDLGGLAVVTGKGVYRQNVGYNPVGYLSSQPAVPASGTAYTNVRGVDCTVYVAGGTVSAISVGGTATGVTSGAVRVPAGSTITLTYSAAPTWTWFGE